MAVVIQNFVGHIAVIARTNTALTFSSFSSKSQSYAVQISLKTVDCSWKFPSAVDEALLTERVSGSAVSHLELLQRLRSGKQDLSEVP